MSADVSRRRFLRGGLATLGTLSVGGCGLASASGYLPSVRPGSIARDPALQGIRVAVGSKNFTEQLVLGKMAGLGLAAAGIDVVDRTNLPGAAAARRQQINGEVDLQWEYTGTGWLNYLAQTTPIPDPQAQYVAVRDMDLHLNDMVWCPPSRANNTYAFAVSRANAERLQITTMSQIKDLPVAERTFCVEAEFASRDDGFVPMLERYGIPLGSPDGVPRENVATLDTGVIYTATAAGDRNFGEVFTTDGRIRALDLVVLEDDLAYFPAYNACVVVRGDLARAHPAVLEVLQPVSDALDNDVLIGLNLQVDVEGREPADVALDWLRGQGFVT